MRYTEIDHFSHPHRLLLVSTQIPYRCDGCKELGFGLCYQCPYEECNFHLHEECGNAPSSISHPFFKTCKYFKFYKETPGCRARFCDACGMDINGFLYQCSNEHAHDLHPCCAKLPKSLSNNGVKINLSNEVGSKCMKCKRKEIANGVKGWSYVSSCGNYCYHVACVKETIIENWKMGYFQTDVTNGENGLELQNIAPSQEVVVSSGESSRWKKTRKLWFILKLVVSAIFGDPVTLISSLVQALMSN
ncbi:hypothetical protein CRYUN_Cryun41cG0019100 [Craigia yunnanensis]